jgi:hypothetical protein
MLKSENSRSRALKCRKTGRQFRRSGLRAGRHRPLRAERLEARCLLAANAGDGDVDVDEWYDAARRTGETAAALSDETTVAARRYGAAGYGPKGYLSAGTLISYRIEFENLGPGSVPPPAEPATDPVQRVEILDPLNQSLDWLTFRFTEVGFGGVSVPVVSDPPWSAFLEIPVSYEGRDLVVQVLLNLDIDPQNPVFGGTVNAVFQTVDPGTGLPPDDSAGFLPPEDGSGLGIGYVSYVVQPYGGTASGTRLDSLGMAMFDGPPMIGIDAVNVNTIDAVPPSSSVAALPETVARDFTVSWSGQDERLGSGIAAYDIYVSDDGGPFTLWLAASTETSALFTGEAGHRYAFYSVAIDNVGHREAAPSVADTETTAAATTSWQNAVDPFDVDGMDGVTAQDVLILINYINAHPGNPALPDPPEVPPPYYDVNGDSAITPSDVLAVINQINLQPAGMGEGEPGSVPPGVGAAGFPSLDLVTWSRRADVDEPAPLEDRASRQHRLGVNAAESGDGALGWNGGLAARRVAAPMPSQRTLELGYSKPSDLEFVLNDIAADVAAEWLLGSLQAESRVVSRQAS